MAVNPTGGCSCMLVDIPLMAKMAVLCDAPALPGFEKVMEEIGCDKPRAASRLTVV